MPPCASRQSSRWTRLVTCCYLIKMLTWCRRSKTRNASRLWSSEFVRICAIRSARSREYLIEARQITGKSIP